MTQPMPPKTESPYFYFEPDALAQASRRYSAAYAAAEPFPHAVMDDFIPDERLLDKILAEFPNPDETAWQTLGESGAQQRKYTQAKDHLFGPSTRHLMSQFNSSTFVRFLEDLTGIKGLVPDPHYLGGGLHQSYRGGFLKIHTDFSWYPELKLKRRLNLLLYLNRDWKEEYGGHVEFWDKSMSRCVKKALPVFNRCVVFNTSRFSYHGHPEPLTCPENRSRRSLALYYYTVADEASPETERFGTLFRKRPGEKFFYLRNLIARCIPPILYDTAIKLEQKFKRAKRI